MSVAKVSHTSSPKLACDACRTRKIKCDKGSPCSNCKSSSYACHTSHRTRKEPRSRVIITQEYEKRFDRIGDRLDRIEACLRRNGSADNNTVMANSAVTAQPLGAPSAMAGGSNDIESPTPGFRQPTSADMWDATTDAHSALASRTAEQAAKKILAESHNPELANALRLLKKLSNEIKDKSSTSDVTSTLRVPQSASDVTPPSRAEVLEILEGADKSLFLAFCPVLDSVSIRRNAEKLFNYPRDATPVDRALVFGALYNLCVEHGTASYADAFSKRCSALAKLFRVRLESAVADLRITTRPSHEAVAAFILAASSAIELCKPYMALSLTSCAASMVITLGYHRLSAMQSDPLERRNAKINLFWTVYMFDTSFSIRLGRAPLIRDHDITVPMVFKSVAMPKGLAEGFRYWIEVGRVQSEALENLYSPAALQQPLEKRVEHASSFVERLQTAWVHRELASCAIYGSVSDFQFNALVQISDSIMHYSTLALVQYASTTVGSGDISALGPARQALRLTVEAKETHTQLSDHIWAAFGHWTLLHAPFTPFTVIFCHIISNPADTGSDLPLLDDYVATLRSLGKLSDGVAKIYRLCDALRKVADMFVRAKQKELQDSSAKRDDTLSLADGIAHPLTEDIDRNVPSSSFPADCVNSYGDGLFNINDWEGTFINNLFWGNSSFMGLMEHQQAFPQQ